MKRWLKRIAAVIIVLGLMGAGAAWYVRRAEAQPLSFRTGEVARDNLVVTISATGTVEPEEVVDVGAQVAGQIIAFGQDKNGKAIDYTSDVDETTVLARIDESVYASDVAEAAAQLEQAKAGVQHAEADLEQMKAKLGQAQADWERAGKLGPSEALAATSYDAYKYGYEIAKANVALDEAAITQSKAAVTQAEAAVQRAQRNLAYCTIKSPVKGVIIDRRVNIGQTVISSLNAPSLFLIAKDLHRMEVWVSVNEMDIGHIHRGQAVTFTVDAYPGETFRGEVEKIRLNASMTQNVVTYIVEITTDNSSGKLLPYLSANVKFELSRRENVLIVPNAALRWSPRADQVAPAAGVSGPAGGRRGAGNSPQPSAGAAQAVANGRSGGMLWVPEGMKVRPVYVTVGPTDGAMTEVEGDKLKEGLEVVLGEQPRTAAAVSTAGPSPFTPRLPGRGGRPAGPPGP